jgi:prepilin-type N-terminal cleavage/methylation domain-containing protein
MLRVRGFTLLEVLLSIALLGLIAGFSAPLYVSFQNRNDLDIATSSTVQNLRRAQMLAQASVDDMAWGLYLQTGSVTIFRGTSFAGRNSNFDEVYPISSSIVISKLEEIIFNKFSGLPTAPSVGTITLTNINNETRDIIINDQGMFEY